MSTTALDPHERDASISWLNVKLWERSAGVDPHDPAVVIVEVAAPDKAWRLDLIGHVLDTHLHVRPDRTTCTRVRALIEADVRHQLGLDGPGAQVLDDVALASRRLRAVPEARAAITEMDVSRNTTRSWNR